VIDLSQLSFHHIGVACKDLGMETDKLKILGYAREGDDFIDPIQGVKGRFLSGQMPRLELLVPLYPDSVLSPWLVRDRLSDSGIIGLVICEKVDKALVIQEICISCRALGRHLESIIISYILHRMIDLLSTKTVVFKWQNSSRNSPALNWLEKFTQVSLQGKSMEISLNNHEILPVSIKDLSVLKINTYYH
jgi:hypothetical protein